METPTQLRKMLQMTQQDMAAIMGVSRSHYSMFESGKRNLPSPAMQKMATLLATANATEVSGKQSQAQAKQRMQQQQRGLNLMLRENEYQQALVSRKINIIKANLISDAQRKALIDQLKRMEQPGQSKMLVERMANASAQDDQTALLKLEIRAEVLRFEESVLREKLKAGE